MLFADPPSKGSLLPKPPNEISLLVAIPRWGFNAVLEVGIKGKEILLSTPNEVL